MDQITTTVISEGTKLATKSLVDRIISPIIDGVKLAYNKKLVHINEHFQEFLLRNYEKYSTMNTLVFSNTQKHLKDIYIPLTITSKEISRKEIKRKIDVYPKDIIDKYKKILIVDTAGMGKSTMMKYVYLSIIDNGIGIPIFVELRRLNASKDIFDEIREQLNAINKEFDVVLLNEFIKDGRLIFILDGYDEIPLCDRNVVTEKVQDFIAKAGNNFFLMTSRPEETLSSFGDFAKFEINPLKKQEAFQLLKKYDNDGVNSGLLINKLKEETSKNIEEFLKNPLLVSLLFTAFDYKQTIPLKKHLFYRQVFDAFFEIHDLSKGESFERKKYSGLDIDEFHRILRFMGYKSLKKIEFSKDELLLIIKEAKEFCVGLNFAESAFLSDLLKSVPIFIRDGNYYKWAHKSLQEYFAGQFIFLDAKEFQSNILKRLYISNDLNKYYNLLDLYYCIDYKGFRCVFIYELLKEFKTFCLNNGVNEHSSDLLKKNCSMMFNGIYAFFVQNDGDTDKILDGFVGNIKSHFKQYSSEFPRIQRPSIYTMRRYKQKEVFLYSRYENSLVNIINILGNESFTFMPKKQKPLKDDDISTVIHLKKELIYIINFSEQKEPFNNYDTFDVEDLIVNYIALNRNEYFLDYNKSMQELDKIEDEMRTMQTKSFLYDF